MGYDRNAAQEAERLYASIDANAKDLKKLRGAYASFKVSLSIEATPHKKSGDYYTPNAVEMPLRAEGLLEEVRRLAMTVASEAAVSRIASCNRRLAQLGFQQVEVEGDL